MPMVFVLDIDSKDIVKRVQLSGFDKMDQSIGESLLFNDSENWRLHLRQDSR